MGKWETGKCTAARGENGKCAVVTLENL